MGLKQYIATETANVTYNVPGSLFRKGSPEQRAIINGLNKADIRINKKRYNHLYYMDHLKIRVERSGGLTGIVSSNEISVEDLPDPIKNKLDKIFRDEQFKTKTPMPKGAADLFNYKITLEGGANSKDIECNQITMNNDLKDLVKYVETKSNKI